MYEINGCAGAITVPPDGHVRTMAPGRIAPELSTMVFLVL